METTIAKITFTDIPNVDDALTLNAHSVSSPSTPFLRTEVFKATRSFSGQTAIGLDINATAQNYADAFELDFASQFFVSVVNEVVTITCKSKPQ